MSDVVIRAASAADLRFLEDMLVEAASAPDRKGRGRVETLADPAVACYVEGWPRATDLGVVAVEEPDRPIGAAWLRLFDDAERAYGFVRPDTGVGYWRRRRSTRPWRRPGPAARVRLRGSRPRL